MSSTVLVTGAGRGLGLEMARQLAARGDRVVATVRDPARADALARLKVRVEPLDLADPGSADALASRLGDEPLDVLINNAGVGGSGPTFERVDWDEVAGAFAVNAIGTMRLTQRLLPALRRGRRKLVASVTSRMGSIEDNTSGGYFAYRASKAGLNMLNKSLSLELAREGFTCVVLHPGWVRTDMGGATAPLTPDQSVASLLRVLDSLKPRDNGRFLDHEGRSLPW